MAYSAKGDEIISEKRVIHYWECVWRHTVGWTREPGSGCEFGDGPPRLRRPGCQHTCYLCPTRSPHRRNKKPALTLGYRPLHISSQHHRFHPKSSTDRSRITYFNDSSPALYLRTPSTAHTSLDNNCNRIAIPRSTVSTNQNQSLPSPS